MRKLGHEIETLALRHLEAQGVQLVCRNFYCRQGEIDIIGLHEECLIFVEVRFRKQINYGIANYGIAEESITANKKRKILHTAQVFLNRWPQFSNYSCRFDVVAVTLQGDDYVMNWIPNAF